MPNRIELDGPRSPLVLVIDEVFPKELADFMRTIKPGAERAALPIIRHIGDRTIAASFVPQEESPRQRKNKGPLYRAAMGEVTIHTGIAPATTHNATLTVPRHTAPTISLDTPPQQ